MAGVDLEAAVQHWFPGARLGGLDRLEGGDVNDLYRVDVGGRGYVLRVGEPLTTAAMVRWEHELVLRVSPVVPEVLAPLRRPDGSTFVEVDGRIASMTVFVEGRRGDRLNESDRDAAAQTLGRLHAALGSIDVGGDREGYPRWAEMEWPEQRQWSWARADRVSIAGHVDLERFERELEALPVAVRALGGSLPSMAIHGDYHADNLLIAGGRVVAVLDWDWCRVDWRAWETSNSVWAFCRDESRTMVDPGLASRFLDRYVRAGGEVLPAELAAFGLLMRAARLREALYVLGEMQREIGADWDYFEMCVEAMGRLEGFEIG